MKADLVHIHAVGPALLVPLAKLLGLQVVFTSHGPDYRKNKWGRLARVVLRCGVVQKRNNTSLTVCRERL